MRRYVSSVDARWCSTWVARHYAPLAAMVLAVAAFNLLFRLGQEVVTEWDESLYAISAWETYQFGNWMGTTFLGSLDYYNSKPPLNIWLIAVAFKVFGPGLISLRLTSAASSWLTVAVLQQWTRRCFGPVVALLASLVLSTTFGFLYVHSGRSGNPDAVMSLLILLTAVTLWRAADRPWVRVWLGPLAAGVFMLKGAAVMIPLVIVALVEWVGRRERQARLAHFATAGLLFALPVVAWAIGRWQVDGSLFFANMLRNDLVGVTFDVLDGHDGDVFFYLDALQKNQYDWIGAALVVTVLVARRDMWRRLRRAVMNLGQHRTGLIVASWMATGFLIPTMMQTKLPWYINPLYPAFAMMIAWLLSRALSSSVDISRMRVAVSVMMIALAAGVAEGRVLWYSFHTRDVQRHLQGMLILQNEALRGRQVFRSGEWARADLFVLRTLHSQAAVATNVEDFLDRSAPGDLLVSTPGLNHPSLSPIQQNAEYVLYQRRDPTALTDE